MDIHVPVLLKESIDALQLKEGDIVVDGTLNVGGHSKVMGGLIGKEGVLVGIDRDANALELAKENLSTLEAKVHLKLGNFRNVDQILDEYEIDTVNAILLDVGLSSRQLEVSGRGFSFKAEEPLMMTFEVSPGEGHLTAGEIVNEWEEEHIRDILEGYGDEKDAYKIANGIVSAREEKKIKTTTQLEEIIKNSLPVWYVKKSRRSVATTTFQALRITVNDELGALKEGIEKGFNRLKSGGRFAVISFHSGEDRIVKRAFKHLKEEGLGKIITKKPLVPKEEEVAINPRARSSKLRIIEKL